jgi:hypothetical protein
VPCRCVPLAAWLTELDLEQRDAAMAHEPLSFADDVELEHTLVGRVVRLQYATEAENGVAIG